MAIAMTELPTHTLSGAYANKTPAYFGAVRGEILDDLAPLRNLDILEIGCGQGATLAAARARGLAKRIVGVEIDAKSAAVARTVADEVHEGDVEKIDLPFATDSFDALIAGEVLEHLIDPWSAMKKLVAFVKPGGRIYVGTPNVAHMSVLRMLIANRWDYADSGRMDFTHLRWFTPATLRELVDAAGCRTTWVRPLVPLTPKQKLVDTLTFGRFSHLFMSQIVLRAQKL